MKKPSFLERLTGSVDTADQYDEAFEGDFEGAAEHPAGAYEEENDWQEDRFEPEEPQEGELPVDMFQTRDEIIIRALVAGVNPDDLEISITRDMVTLRGRRDEYQEAQDEDYYHRELFWGGFSRTLLLPEEVVIDESEAKEKHGMLEIRLPKLDKNRSTQLKVKGVSK